MNNAIKFYEQQIIKINEEIHKVKNIINKISVIRLITFILTIVVAYYFYKLNNIRFIVSSIVIGTLIFLFFAYSHNLKINRKKELEIYLNINKRGINRINGSFREEIDNGEEYLNEKHPFINDLDIFGRSSLFQMINSTKTKFGRENLVEILSLKKLLNKKEIIKKQEAIRELGSKIEFRQRLEVRSTIEKRGVTDTIDLINWMQSDMQFNTLVKFIPYIFIFLTTTSILLVIMGYLPITYIILVFMINYIVVKISTKNLVEVINLFENNKNDIEAYYNLIEIIDKEEFKSELLNDIKNKLNRDDKNIVSEMKALKNLSDWIGDSSSNAYYLLLNVTILSDIFILKNLYEWKKRNGKNFDIWLKSVGEIEALCSIANLAFDFEEWTYPVISDLDEINAVEISHPMLYKKAVSNTFSLNTKNKKSKVALITGSNMSGKSTFLRTIGINLVLAYIGAPVCAKSFETGIFSIHTCMRTKDNLEESISSFYAEILRIKILIEASRKGEKVFFLLDEIFKGTNSKDRHEGATVLIKQLANNKAMGLVSTHDLELCELENQYNWIKNYNFQEYYIDNNIKFDYKLREGKSKTQNAIHLMKLAGIEF